MSEVAITAGALPGGAEVVWPILLPMVALVAGLMVWLLVRRDGLAMFGTGLRLGLVGLVGKELRSRSRGWRPMLLLTGYLAALTVGVAGFLNLLTGMGGTVSPSVGGTLFSALALTAVVLLAFITPALTVGAISGERERRTLDLLLVTRASPVGLVLGKLAGSLVAVLYLLVASLPAFALVYLFGGIPIQYLLMVLAVAAVTAVVHAALGLWLSALLKRTVLASVVAYLLVAATMLGLPVLGAATSFAQASAISARPVPPPTAAPVAVTAFGSTPAGQAPPAYVYLSPLVSLWSVLPTGLTTTATRGLTGTNAGSQPPSPFHAVYVTAVDPQTGQPQTVTLLAPWVHHFAFSGLLTLLAVLGAALAVMPVAPWRTRVTGIRGRGAGTGGPGAGTGDARTVPQEAGVR